MTSRERNVAPIAITTGDPSGIGPEIVCRALADLGAERRSNVLVIGAQATLERASALTGVGLHFVAKPKHHFEVELVQVDTPEFDSVRDGQVSVGGGHAAFGYVKRAVEMALSGKIGVIVTAPLNKAALNVAGYHYDGHTGMLQSLTSANSSFMLLASPRLSTIHVSTHVSMSEAVRRVQPERVIDTILAGHAHLRELGMASPRIAVAGLNPHCGEGGLFGDEEMRFIVPAVDQCRANGIDVHGPLPGDTVFYRAFQGEFDLVVANYHDQGHIPTKLVAFDTTVNISLGLPIRRTSVDHGTAFDIAWKGVAKHANLLAAVEYAERLSPLPTAR